MVEAHVEATGCRSYPGRGRPWLTGLLDWMYGNVWVRKRVRLDVLSHNDRAIAFYRAYGYQAGCVRMEK